MNTVGREGRGESVSLGWFCATSWQTWLRWHVSVVKWNVRCVGRLRAALCKAALLSSGWDGPWFCRAYFDDGEKLGASANAECRIDLIAQAWSQLSGVASAPMQWRDGRRRRATSRTPRRGWSSF
ncbi:MAG: hypothetical protein IPH35_09020 [Rhodoferax sp.]|nr:hypothetical protein [Rhodoferax sp.]